MPRAKPKATDSAAVPPPSKVSWPADNVTRQPVAQLIPYATNARTHTQEQIGQIAASIQQWGWTMPVLVDEDNVIIAGHARVLAAQKLGMKECPVMVASGWSDAQKRAYVIADNKLSLNAGWDQELLKLELTDLGGTGFDMELIGFSPDELNALMFAAPVGLTDPDDAPPAPVHPVTRAGDVWLLGKHRLVCGDATVPGDVALALNGVRPHLMVTDPPYGVEYDPAWRNRALRADGTPIGGRAIGKVDNDERADWRAAWKLFPGDVAYCWHGERQLVELAQQLQDCSFEARNLIVWGKGQLVIGRGHYHSQHETCWYAVRKGSAGHWAGDRKQTTLWQIDKPRKSDTGHSTQKPVECMKRPIENNSSIGQAVYDPFCGSGTTVIAGEICGRAVHALELNPAYCDVIVLRWQAFTGKDATLEETGTTFAGMSELRPIEEGADVA
jgi:DNA modification methylase